VIDVEDTLRGELHRLVPIEARPDWEEVVARSGLKRERARRRWAVAMAVALTAAALGVATPLGSAIVNGLGDFSAWLSGQPGSPVTQQEQREFDEANARSWLGFPEGTKLRRLITHRAGSTTVELLGFRSGSSALCLRVVAKGAAPGKAMSCAPLAELQRAGAPARVVIVDHGVGRGRDAAWYGIDFIRSSALRMTAGIAADDVRSVVLEDDTGRHEVPARSNAFLYVAVEPKVEQRVLRIWARTSNALAPVSFAPAPFMFGGRPAVARPAAPAPDVERQLTGGRIGWLEAREERGDALEVLPPRARSSVLGHPTGVGSNVLFGRVLTPDEDRPRAVVLTLNAHRPGGPVAGICKWLVTRGGLAGGGCSPYPGVFSRTPIPSGMSFHGPGEFVNVEGLASDDVERVEALLADGQRADVDVTDNVFLIDLPRANLPARLVAYDDAGRVIGVSRPFADFADHSAPARGRAVSLWRVTGPDGAHAELFVGPSTSGGECMFVKHFIDARHRGVGVMCEPPRWRDGPLELGGGTPFISGRVRADVKLVRIRFADGSSKTVRPRRGYILMTSTIEMTAAEGLGADGSVVGRSRFGPSGG
jgi:hypothetical protein